MMLATLFGSLLSLGASVSANGRQLFRVACSTCIGASIMATSFAIRRSRSACSRCLSFIKTVDAALSESCGVASGALPLSS